MKILNFTNQNNITKYITKHQSFKGKRNDSKCCEQKGSIPYGVYLPSEITIQKNIQDRKFQDFLNKKGKVTIEEYRDIEKNSPAIILQARKFIEKEAKDIMPPEVNAKAAIAIKNTLDERFKSTGYTLISMGTSPASITETMQAIGSEVIFIPVSGLNLYINYSFTPYEDHNISRYPNISKILKYLEKKGVKSKKEDSKPYVLTDFCITGKSLSTMYDLIIEHNKVPKKSIKRSDIALLLYNAREHYLEKKSNSPLTKEDIKLIIEKIVQQNIEKIANVPHFHIDQKNERPPAGNIDSRKKTDKKLFEEFESFSQPLARAYSLCSIHEAIKLLDKKNPDKNPD